MKVSHRRLRVSHRKKLVGNIKRLQRRKREVVPPVGATEGRNIKGLAPSGTLLPIPVSFGFPRGSVPLPPLLESGTDIYDPVQCPQILKIPLLKWKMLVGALLPMLANFFPAHIELG